MIHYALLCAAGHEFDGWFPGSVAFDRQAEGGLLACPVCAGRQVSRAMMAPRVSSGARPMQAAAAAPAANAVAAPVASLAVGGPPPMPDQMRAALQRIRAEVESKCDYVGPHFAQAARAMHDGTETPRPIYGETTPEQADALAEDGIEVARIPWVPRADG